MNLRTVRRRLECAQCHFPPYLGMHEVTMTYACNRERGGKGGGGSERWWDNNDSDQLVSTDAQGSVNTNKHTNIYKSTRLSGVSINRGVSHSTKGHLCVWAKLSKQDWNKEICSICDECSEVWTIPKCTVCITTNTWLWTKSKSKSFLVIIKHAILFLPS